MNGGNGDERTKWRKACYLQFLLECPLVRRLADGGAGAKGQLPVPKIGDEDRVALALAALDTPPSPAHTVEGEGPIVGQIAALTVATLRRLARYGTINRITGLPTGRHFIVYVACTYLHKLCVATNSGDRSVWFQQHDKTGVHPYAVFEAPPLDDDAHGLDVAEGHFTLICGSRTLPPFQIDVRYANSHMYLTSDFVYDADVVRSLRRDGRPSPSPKPKSEPSPGPRAVDRRGKGHRKRRLALNARGKRGEARGSMEEAKAQTGPLTEAHAKAMLVECWGMCDPRQPLHLEERIKMEEERAETLNAYRCRLANPAHDVRDVNWKYWHSTPLAFDLAFQMPNWMRRKLVQLRAVKFFSAAAPVDVKFRCEAGECKSAGPDRDILACSAFPVGIWSGGNGPRFAICQDCAIHEMEVVHSPLDERDVCFCEEQLVAGSQVFTCARDGGGCGRTWHVPCILKWALDQMKRGRQPMCPYRCGSAIPVETLRRAIGSELVSRLDES